MSSRAFIANVGGVCVVEITVEAQDAQAIILPAPTVTESQRAKPTMVEVRAVQAANVRAEELKMVEGDPADGAPHTPEVARRVYPV